MKRKFSPRSKEGFQIRQLHLSHILPTRRLLFTMPSPLRCRPHPIQSKPTLTIETRKNGSLPRKPPQIKHGFGVGVSIGARCGGGIRLGLGEWIWVWNHLNLLLMVDMGFGIGLGFGYNRSLGLGFGVNDLGDSPFNPRRRRDLMLVDGLLSTF